MEGLNRSDASGEASEKFTFPETPKLTEAGMAAMQGNPVEASEVTVVPDPEANLEGLDKEHSDEPKDKPADRQPSQPKAGLSGAGIRAMQGLSPEGE